MTLVHMGSWNLTPDVLAAIGFCSPPQPDGWAPADRAALDQAGAALFDLAAHDGPAELAQHDTMRAAAVEAHAAVLRRWPTFFWPRLATGGVDLSPAVCWGVEWFHEWAVRRGDQHAADRVRRHHRIADCAILAVYALHAAIDAWQAGGPAAWQDVPATRAIDALDRALRHTGRPFLVIPPRLIGGAGGPPGGVRHAA
jgi:hypothetical protein